MTVRTAAIVLLALLSAAPAWPQAVDAGWSEVARDRDENCAIVVTGNGQFYRIAASGLAPGAPGRYVLVNGDMRPLDWVVRADAAGSFARYYLPFRWHHTGGTVSVALDTPGCRLAASFPWRRASVAVR